MVQLKVADGSVSTATGTIWLPITSGTHTIKTRVIVAPALSSALILGMDVIRSMTLAINDLQISFQPSQQISTATIHSQPTPSANVTSTLDEICLEQTCSHLATTDREQLQNLLQQFQCLFRATPGTLTTNYRFPIHTTSNSPIHLPPYRQGPKAREVIEKNIQNLLDQGLIRPSTSPWSSPVVLVPKKNGTMRMCVDYRKLNTITIRDQYPLPRIDDTFDQLHNAAWFTTLDLVQGYHQLPLDDEAIPKTAFVTHKGLFEYLRLPFGLCNAPAGFQRCMDGLLGGLKHKCLLVYLDDIIVFSPTFQQHLEDIQTTFTRLQESGLTVNAPKCAFAQRSLRYLGHIVSAKGIQVDPDRTDAISKIPIPTSMKHLRSFLGAANFYRRFIEGFSSVAQPLFKLLKTPQFTWTPAAEQAFNQLKCNLTSAPVLAFPDFSLPFEVHTDASQIALGAVLMQAGKPIQFSSRTLHEPERSYPTWELEILAAVWAINMFRPYLEFDKFTLITDSTALLWLHKLKDPSGRLRRWLIRLTAYDFTVVHRKGTRNVVPDLLSRTTSGTPFAWTDVSTITLDFKNHHDGIIMTLL